MVSWFRSEQFWSYSSQNAAQSSNKMSEEDAEKLRQAGGWEAAQARQRQAAQRVIQDGLNVRDTEKLAARLQKNETNDGPAAGATPDVHVADLQNRLTEALANQVSPSYRKGTGSLTHRFLNDDHLEPLLGKTAGNHA